MRPEWLFPCGKGKGWTGQKTAQRWGGKKKKKNITHSCNCKLGSMKGKWWADLAKKKKTLGGGPPTLFFSKNQGPRLLWGANPCTRGKKNRMVLTPETGNGRQK